jgi:hypothetical protein
MKAFRNLLIAAGLAALTHVNGAAMACAACYGISDSPMAKGMNAGILALLGIIGSVLACATTFFVFLAHRSKAIAKAQKVTKS